MARCSGRWRWLPSSSQCTDPTPSSPTLVSDSPPSQCPLDETDLRSIHTHRPLHHTSVAKVKAARTRSLSVGFQSWSRFLAVSLQVTWVINLAVGCHYFPPSPQLPSQPLRELLPISLLRSEPKPYCTWVQHANHSATEPPHRYIQILNIL